MFSHIVGPNTPFFVLPVEQVQKSDNSVDYHQDEHSW